MNSKIFEKLVQLFVLCAIMFSIIINPKSILKNINNPVNMNSEKEIEEFLLNYKMNKNDNMTFSQADGAVQHKLDFDVDIDMEKRIIEGRVRIHYKCLKETNFVGLDIRDLIIYHIKDEKENDLKYIKYINTKNSIGDGLIVMLKDNCRTNSFIDILYATLPYSIGIHFSDPSILHNKNYSFLYTHGEAIYGRTIFPSQDTPSLKVTSSAKIRIKKPYSVLYSGEYQSEKMLENNKKEYFFIMEKPIPTYLITFAAGVFKKKEIQNSKCEVWGEKEALSKWVDESFKYCDKYIEFYETYKPLAFNKMRFLIVPNDFPFSGMENPYVIYISESVLTKDMSYTNVIAHEIAHFWSGNLVTNKNWGSFWLNEGITTYLNRKAYRVIHGEEIFSFEMYEGLFKLEHELKDLRKNKQLDSSFRSLSPKFTDDPYKTFGRIPYEKGSFFLYYLETLIGDSIMHKVMSDYFNNFEFKSLDTNNFIQFFKDKVMQYHEKGKEIINEVNWNEWLNGTEGLPVDLKFSSKKLENFKNKLHLFKNEENSILNLKEIFSPMKIVEKERLLKELSEDINKLSIERKKLFTKFLEEETYFNDHINISTIRRVIQADLIEDKNKKKDALIDILEKVDYYKVSHLKKVFRLLETTNRDKNFLFKILKTYKKKLNPITLERINELILSFA